VLKLELHGRDSAPARSRVCSCATANKARLAIFGDPIITSGILDRLLQHSTTINIRGESYRAQGTPQGRPHPYVVRYNT